MCIIIILELDSTHRICISLFFRFGFLLTMQTSSCTGVWSKHLESEFFVINVVHTVVHGISSPCMLFLPFRRSNSLPFPSPLSPPTRLLLLLLRCSNPWVPHKVSLLPPMHCESSSMCGGCSDHHVSLARDTGSDKVGLRGVVN